MLLAEKVTAFRPLVPPETGTLLRSFLRSAPPAGLLDFAIGHTWSRRLLLTAERLILPGIILHYLVRKQQIEVHARDFLRDHPDSRIVVLGAGLDTLAWRLRTEFPGTFIELDHPATQALKLRCRLHPRPVLLPVDFSRADPANVLISSPDFSPATPALFIAEGLLMYFPPERVAVMLQGLARIAGPGSQLVFTFMEQLPGEPLRFRGASRLIDRWLRIKREPFLWGISRDAMSGFLAGTGWRLEQLSSPEGLRARFLDTPERSTRPLAEGESVVLARKP